MSAVSFNKKSVVLNLYIDKPDGITMNFFIWLWFVENIVKIKIVRESDKPWLNCELPRSCNKKSKIDNFRNYLRAFYEIVLSDNLPFKIQVADEVDNKDISVISKTSNFSLIRESLFGIVADIGESVKTQLDNLNYGSFFWKDGKPAVLYGPLSLANNRCGSSIAFGEMFNDCIVHKLDYRLYTKLKLKSKSLKDYSKPPKVSPDSEILIKYCDGKKKYVCNCHEHQRKRSKLT